MSYLAAKLVIMQPSPRIPFKLIVIEAALLVCVAGLLVRIFA